MYPDPIRNAPRLHQDSRGALVTPGDWLVDSLNPTLLPVQVVRLHGAGQFVYFSEATGEELTSFCCCFTICPPPAPQGSSKSLAAPAAAGQGVCTQQIDAVLRPLLLRLISEGLTLEQAVLRIGYAIGLVGKP